MKTKFILRYILVSLCLYGCNGNQAVTQTKEQDSENHDSVEAESIESSVTVSQDDTISLKNAAYIKDIPLPDNFERINVKLNSFAAFLRGFEIDREDNTIHSYRGEPIYDQESHVAVLKCDVGNSDLQQCADAVIRLRAEYLYFMKRYDEIHFNFVNGKTADYTTYCKSDYSYPKFRKYLNWVFSYANTLSLKKELVRVENISDIQIGDVFIQSGNPYGHAIIVVDLAFNTETGEKIFMVAQSFMPAQEIHILKNPSDVKLSPWYSADIQNDLVTPKWVFQTVDLRRFK